MKKKISLLLVIMAVWTACLYAQTAVRPPGGGTIENPFLVSTLENLHFIHLNPGGGKFVQIADIDASATRNWDGGKGFLPIGSSGQPFQGIYDGNGYAIRGLYINRPTTDNTGFFGYTIGGEIQNVGLVDAHITGKNNVGGIIGAANFSNTLSGCFVTGAVKGSSGVGGLIGMANEMTINNCYTSCTVTGAMFDAGGLVGANAYCGILNCYATGNVSGLKEVGGLVGSAMSASGVPAMALLSGCYYSGKVSAESETEGGSLIGYNSSFSIVSSCYWNSQTSGVASGYGSNSGTFSATGLTTAQMTHPGSFSGWNFSTQWKIRAGETCPALYNVSDNAPFAFAETLSEHSAQFAIAALLSNDFDYETLQASLVVKIRHLSAGHYDAHTIYFPGTSHMGDTLSVTYMVGEVRAAKHDTLWGNMATSELIYFNRTPEISAVTSKITSEDMPVSIVIADITATDPDNDPVSLVIFQGDNYSVSGNTITPAPDFNGPLSVGIAATDGAFNSDTAFMDITVTPVNDAPVLTAVNAKIIWEDSSFTLTTDDVTISDAEGDPLSFIVGEGGNYSLAGLTISPSPDFFGILSVPISISDGTDTSAILILKITVTPVNDPPVITSTAVSTAAKDEEYMYDVTVSDVDDTVFTYSLEWRPVGMTISDSGTIRWTPAGGITSSGEVLLAVSDGELEDTETFTITVTNVNNAPVVRDTTVTTDGNAPVIVLTDAHDTDGTITSISLDRDPQHGTAIRSGLSVTYTPDPGFAGLDSLTWHAVDNDGLVSNMAKIYVVVTAVTGVENETGAGILLYPNPCTDGFYVNAGEEPEELTICELKGKVVLRQLVTGLTRIPVPNLPNGMYIVTVNGQTIKLITKN